MRFREKMWRFFQGRNGMDQLNQCLMWFYLILALFNTFVGSHLIYLCVVALIAQTVLGLWKKSVKDKLCIAIFAVIFVLSLFTKISPVLLVVCCGVIGVLAGALRKGEGEAK